MEWIWLKKQSTFVNKTINSFSFLLHFDLICCIAFKIFSSMFKSDCYANGFKSEWLLLMLMMPETMRKLWLSANFALMEIRWNYSFFCSVHSFLQYQFAVKSKASNKHSTHLWISVFEKNEFLRNIWFF